MNDEPIRPAGVPDDWEAPIWRAQQKVWADLPDDERTRLQALSNERDAEGRKTWSQALKDDPDDSTWTEYFMRTVDPNDPRPDERIGRWPKSWVDDQQRRGEDLASVDEEFDVDDPQ